MRPSSHFHTSPRSYERALECATHVNNAGMDGIFFADSHLNTGDPFQYIAGASRSTDGDVTYGIAVTNMIFRDPTVLASSAATAGHLTGDRFILGLGTGDGTTERLKQRPTKMVDFEEGTRQIRQLLDGNSLDGNPQARLNPGNPSVKVYLSVEGPRGLRVAGRVADGVILGTGFDLGVIEWARDRIAEGAADVGRDPNDVDLMAAGILSIGNDGEACRERVKPRIANRAHHNFRASLDTVAEQSERDAIVRFLDGFDRKKPLEERADPKLITPYMLNRFSIAGTAEECRSRVLELQRAGINSFLLTPPEADFFDVVTEWATMVNTADWPN